MGKNTLATLRIALLKVFNLTEKEPASNSAEWDIAEDEVEIKFPVEFFIEAVPLSLQASAASRQVWAGQVRDRAAARVLSSSWATESPVMAKIFYFPHGRMVGDIDNIVKPILDALKHLIYVDDSQMDRVIVQKFESDRSFRIENPTPMLAAALETEPPVVYVRIDDEVSSSM